MVGTRPAHGGVGRHATGVVAVGSGRRGATARHRGDPGTWLPHRAGEWDATRLGGRAGSGTWGNCASVPGLTYVVSADQRMRALPLR